MKEGQHDICHITDESIAVVSSSSFRENLRKKSCEVLYMDDPVDEFAVQQSKEFDGKTVKFTPEDRFDLGDHDEKNKLEELKAEFKSLMRLLKEVIGDQVEKVSMSGRTVDLPCAPTTSKYGWSANMQRITQQRDSSPQQQRDNQPHVARQSVRQERGKERGERKKERKGEGERGRSEQEEKGREGRESVRKGERGKEEEKEAEEGGDEQVAKDVTGWTEVTRKRRRKTVQIFVKVNGSKATPMEVNLTDDKVEDVMRRIQKDEYAYVTMHGRVLQRCEKLKSCEVTDGCTIQVTSRLRGGGKHKDKKSKAEKRPAASAKQPEPLQMEKVLEEMVTCIVEGSDVEGEQRLQSFLATIQKSTGWDRLSRRRREKTPKKGIGPLSRSKTRRCVSQKRNSQKRRKSRARTNRT